MAEKIYSTTKICKVFLLIFESNRYTLFEFLRISSIVNKLQTEEFKEIWGIQHLIRLFWSIKKIQVQS